MNLHTTLKAYNEANVLPEQELIIKEVNSIIAEAEKTDLSILVKLGMDSNIREFGKIQLEKQQAETFEEIYDVSVIRKMAINYGLRFLPSNLYTGTIDPLLPSVLNRFIDKHKIEVSLSEKPREKQKSNFYILAPASSFELQERPKDPIMFYKINENKYAFVHKWGNDLSNIRKIANYPFRNAGNFAMIYILALSIIVWPLVLILGRYEPCIIYSLLFILLPVCLECDFNVGKWNSTFKSDW